MEKVLSYGELIALAKAHYSEGGDGIFECWDERDFDRYVAEFGGITEEIALEMFRDSKDMADEIAGW